MGTTKHFTDEDKMEEMEWEVKEDKIITNMYCLKCGNTPDTWPVWTGKENWYAGHCHTCDEYEEFMLDPEDRSEI